MTFLNYNDPGIKERRCDEQLAIVAQYLRSQKLEHGQISDWPAWHVAPHVALWAIESRAQPGWVGWWAISGDLPTDYISAADVSRPQHPRKALRVFAQNWLEVVEAWKSGREIANTRIGDWSMRDELEPLLQSRASLLMEWSEDDVLWEVD